MSILDVCSSASTCDQALTTAGFISTAVLLAWVILALTVFKPKLEEKSASAHERKIKPHPFAPFFLSVWVIGVPIWFLYEYGYMHPALYEVVDDKGPIKDQKDYENMQWTCYKKPHILHEGFGCRIDEGEVERVDHAQELASKIWLAVVLCLGVVLGIKWPPSEG